MSAPVNSGQIQAGRFRKGRSGNPAGKPRGAQNRATRFAEALLDGQADALVRKAVEMALSGDPTALRLCLERLIPPRRERPLEIKLPPLKTAADAVTAIAAIAAATAQGSITASEAAELSRLIENFVSSVKAQELAQRLELLEEEVKHGDKWS
jgi:hypothetical protein